VGGAGRGRRCGADESEQARGEIAAAVAGCSTPLTATRKR
jgi:hypothetical protein